MDESEERGEYEGERRAHDVRRYDPSAPCATRRLRRGSAHAGDERKGEDARFAL